MVAAASRHPHPGETVLGTAYAQHPGGKGLNQAVAAARAGATVRFVGAVGNDDAGRLLFDVLSSEGIDASEVRTSTMPTGRAVIVVADEGENTIVVVPGANADAVVTSLPPCDVVLAQLELRLAVIAGALRTARERGILTMLNPAPVVALGDALREALAMCDVVVPNEHELVLLGGAPALLATGVGTVIVTKGARGVDVVRGDGVEHVDAHEVTPVDTTGAGDTFCGYLAAGLAAGVDDGDAVRRAVVAAALSTTRAGAVPSIPTASEVDAAAAQEASR
ncbi:MAG: ribokinase [Actinomycetota bacterium]|nr:ribokinase [Actinomycetota bacterium]